MNHPRSGDLSPLSHKELQERSRAQSGHSRHSRESGNPRKTMRYGKCHSSGKFSVSWTAVVGAWCMHALVFAGEVLDECPRDHLRAVYLQAVERHEVVDLAAVEVEVLKLCRERQGLISEIVRGEEELAELLATHAGEPGPARARADSDPLPALLPASRERSPAAAGSETRGTLSLVSGRTEKGERAPPLYRWFTVYGSGSELFAGVSDGVERWWVRAGDELPGGVEVVSVRVRPVSVRAAAGERQWQLPGPGGAPARTDGGESP